MEKFINISALLLLVLLISTGITEKGEAQAQRYEWECKLLPNFKCWMGHVGENLCNDLCKNEGAIRGLCISDANSHRCLCHKSGCS